MIVGLGDFVIETLVIDELFDVNSLLSEAALAVSLQIVFTESHLEQSMSGRTARLVPWRLP